MNLQWPLIQAIVKLMFRHPICGVAIVPILEDGRLVLVRRQDDQSWGLPGGVVDWGEDIATTLHRELREETGLQVIQIGRLVGVYSSPQRDPRGHSICVTIEAIVKGEFCIEDTHEISDVQAFSRQEVPYGQLTHDHDRQLADYWKGTTTLA
jgi:ADP-ribose pyrophosphatase YjhB (NUDIX family)